ncbi:MAG: cbb3-type cytochrome c oxidase subunit I, partial [Candidatus Heimdallarchaeota archaeon]|nr:cbb3-type cytochrome c oxidase subunit I [Candidatus Heimdallarchaeota archaeon]
MAEEHELDSTFWKNPKEWFGSTNAQQIAVLYFALTFINAAIGGLMALLIRTELWTYEASFFQTAAEYNSAFTLHGSAMIFLVIVPLGAGFGNLLVPRMVAADNNDMYWPRWNNIAFWLLPLGSWLMWTSGAQGAWTVYPPLSLSIPGIDGWIAGLVLVGTSSTIGGINFILTIWKGRAPYIKWSDLDLFVWATLFTSFLAFLATPVLTVALVMVLMDRNFGTFFFDGSLGNPVMFQHIFWFYSHPAVYIMVVPAFGLVSHLISKYARRPIFGYSAMVGSMGAI